MPRFGSGLEWLIVLALVLLLFGVGRISKIGGELGSGIRSFRKGLKGEDEGEEQAKTEAKDEAKKE